MVFQDLRVEQREKQNTQIAEQKQREGCVLGGGRDSPAVSFPGHEEGRPLTFVSPSMVPQMIDNHPDMRNIKNLFSFSQNRADI